MGEACHFVDLITYLCDEKIDNIYLNNCKDEKLIPDTFSLNIKYSEGSIGTIHYFSNGSKLFPKERLEVFTQNKIFQLNDFYSLKAWGVKGFKNIRLLRQDKGNSACASEFINAITIGKFEPIPRNEIFNVQEFLLEAIG